MLRKLLIGLCLFTAINASAQNKVIIPEKTAGVAIDYKQIGAPLPELLVIAYNDTATLKDTTSGKKQTTKKKKKNTPKTYQPHGKQEHITASTLKSSGNLFIMMFNPTCGHCDAMATLLEENIGLFKTTKILLLANRQMIAYMPEFAGRHHIQEHPAMYMGTDSSGFIDNVFLYQALPQINIYNAERKLLKTYAGETPFDSLRKYIQ